MAAVTKSNDGKDAMADVDLPGEGDEAEEPKKSSEPSNRTKKPSPSGKGYFTIYKKGQGYWTRMGTVIAAGLLGLMISFELYNQIQPFLHGSARRDRTIAFGVSVVFLAAYSAFVFWFINKPTTADFLIATDSEMKKVNWTTRKELIGSTKIVILFMFLIALYLFTCDLLFGGFFHLIGVLKTIF